MNNWQLYVQQRNHILVHSSKMHHCEAKLR